MPLPGGAASLLGRWRVESSSRVGSEIELTLGSGDLSYVSVGLKFYGSWRAAANGLFVAHLFAIGGEGAESAAVALPAWLEPTRCRRDGDGFVLIGDSGDVVTALSPIARSLEVSPPGSRAATPLPPHLRPATRQRLVGRWEPVEDRGRRPSRPFLSIFRDHAWSGSDGCNTTTGRWVADDEGSVLCASGMTTLAFCWGVPLPRWWARSARAGFVGDELVLVDDGGVTLGQLRRGDAPTSSR